jgi:hypothetical protein
VRITIVAALLSVLAACGPAPADEATAASTPVDGPSASARTLTGLLGGDPDLEGGCVWLDTDDGRVEVLWPDGYGASADPVQLRDEDAVVAREGDEVTITGGPAADRVSTCQVGTLWTATSVDAGAGS